MEYSYNMDSLENKLEEVRAIRKKLIKAGYHLPISWHIVKRTIIHNAKQIK